MGHKGKLFHLLVIVSVWTSVVAAGADKHDCHTFHEYHELMGLTHHGCNDIFSELHNLFKIGPVCGQTVVTTLASFYHTNHVACHCTGSYTLPIYPPEHKNDNHLYCMHVSQHYTKLYSEYFQDAGQTVTAQCTTYQKVWGELKNLMTESMPCYDDMILHLSKAYEHVRPDCHCHEGAAVTHPPITMVPTTMAPTTLAPTSMAPTTTAPTTTAPAPYVNSGAMTLPIATTTDIAMHCSNVSGLGFDKLMLFLTTDECASANTVWGYLNQVMAINPACMDTLLKYLAVKYQNGNPSNCECHPSRPLHNVHLAHTKCKDVHEGTFKEIYGDLFEHQDHNGCKDHSYLWTRLMGIQNHRDHPNFSCQHQLIDLAAVAYPIGSQTPCVCTTVNPAGPVTTMAPVPSTTRPTQAPTQAPTTSVPTTTTTTTTTTSTAAPTTTVPTTAAATATSQPSTTTPVVTTTLAPVPTTTHKAYSCDINNAMHDIASSVNVQNPLATPCHLTGNDESLVLTECNLPVQTTWKRGTNVLADCQSPAPSIPSFVPIATFSSDTFVSAGAHSAIFLKCTATGFQAIVEYCGNPPYVVDLSPMPNVGEYHTIV